MKVVGSKWWVLAGLGLVVGVVLVFQVAVRQMRVGVEQALGPRASVGSLGVGWSGVVITDLRVRAERPRWPAEDELRAARVVVVPELSSVFRAAWRVRLVRVEGAYVSLLRKRDGGLQVVPGLVRTEAKPEQTGRPVNIGRIELVDAAVEFFDATVRQPPHRMRFERLNAELEDLALPGLDQPVQVALSAVFKGPKRDGDITLNGHVVPATRNGELNARLTGVDLIALEPYLLKVHEAGVKRGTLDLTLDAKVEHQRLHAPGVVTLKDLELGTGSGVFGTFAGVPRQAVLASLDRNGRIELKFTLEGRLDDPKFSVNEALSLRIAAGLAESLGVSLGGVVEGVGGVIKGLFGH
ncbi:DUF748 domain-containing protein [Piscinibacter gummiphilus]|uniref:DUF748 domain-containing protein n=1 Tax=Piscinibacter gummiphilus TaxID=946333 RepID=UPI000A26FA98|nr:DUF748 domain-containing protein [Piscinibacter gummiphilus]ATU63822.1 DUF748 domain-containing protein [Piscinibacter gummiphilus]